MCGSVTLQETWESWACFVLCFCFVFNISKIILEFLTLVSENPDPFLPRFWKYQIIKPMKKKLYEILSNNSSIIISKLFFNELLSCGSQTLTFGPLICCFKLTSLRARAIWVPFSSQYRSCPITGGWWRLSYVIRPRTPWGPGPQFEHLFMLSLSLLWTVSSYCRITYVFVMSMTCRSCS